MSYHAVGGAEQVLAAIDSALVASGHRSIVVAVEGSEVAGELASYSPALRGMPLTQEVIAKQQRRAGAALRSLLDEVSVDLVHMHGIDFMEYLPAGGHPVLVTLHVPLSWYRPEALNLRHGNTWLHCVSDSQAAAAAGDRMLPPIPNGVPVTQLGALELTKRDYALVLARVCPEKGIHFALEASRRADLPLLIGGEVYPYSEHQSYFEEQVRPLLDHRRRYLGPLSFRRKRRLLTGARCLLVSSLAETSSLVAMEAAACGTPTIAFRNAALAEIVEHGRTGWLVDDVESMIEAIFRADLISPAECKAVARERFAVERMTSAYLARYAELVSLASARNA